MEKNTTPDPEQFREAMRSWTAGVTVVTASFDGEMHGMTVNSFTSVALDPPVVLISLQAGSRTQEMISQAQVFGVTILPAEQKHLSDRFAGRYPEIIDRFADLATETLQTGAPFIKGGLAYFDCQVTQAVPVGSSVLFLAEVVAARSFGVNDPLVYHNRQYWQLTKVIGKKS